MHDLAFWGFPGSPGKPSRWSHANLCATPGSARPTASGYSLGRAQKSRFFRRFRAHFRRGSACIALVLFWKCGAAVRGCALGARHRREARQQKARRGEPGGLI